MNGLDLKAARLLLGLSQNEAAEEIGKVNQRSWAYWESGERSLPPDVVETINELISRRNKTIALVRQKKELIHGTVVVFYEKPEDAGMTLLEVRYNNSLAAQLHFEFGVNLIKFEPEDYVEWLTNNGLIDSPQKRSEWAVNYFLKNN